MKLRSKSWLRCWHFMCSRANGLTTTHTCPWFGSSEFQARKLIFCGEFPFLEREKQSSRSWFRNFEEMIINRYLVRIRLPGIHGANGSANWIDRWLCKSQIFFSLMMMRHFARRMLLFWKMPTSTHKNTYIMRYSIPITEEMKILVLTFKVSDIPKSFLESINESSFAVLLSADVDKCLRLSNCVHTITDIIEYQPVIIGRWSLMWARKRNVARLAGC